MKSLPLTEKKLKSMDAVIIITDHSQYDYEWIYNTAELIIDTRNALKRPAGDRLVKA